MTSTTVHECRCFCGLNENSLSQLGCRRPSRVSDGVRGDAVQVLFVGISITGGMFAGESFESRTFLRLALCALRRGHTGLA